MSDPADNTPDDASDDPTGGTGAGAGPLRRHVQVYRTARSAHLERARAIGDVTLLYRTRRGDFDLGLLAGLDVRQVGPWEVARLLLTSRPDTVEVNEPLMLPAAPTAWVAMTAARLGARLRRRRVRVVSYAIENRDPRRPVPTGPGARLRHGLQVLAARSTARGLDRLAFGTPGAEALYREVVDRPAVRGATAAIPALPAPCDCPVLGQDPNSVLFLGSLEPRKGFDLLAAAWPAVAAATGASLTVVGSGPLAPAAAELAGRVPGVRVVADASRARVHEELRRAEVLVLPSQPARRWREQVGLPLVEGWAHGCRLVATEETGIAAELRAGGHVVVPADGDPATVSDAVLQALGQDRDAADVLAALPAEDGRAAADRWLTAP
ncbi:glycosyltransferase [Kineococcus gynurae]|uniref:Glycosyltransferase n=1 Tax=Kineococcus gynurae TaxID=452979 RepID=A0ABV5LXU1_9ACTN